MRCHPSVGWRDCPIWLETPLLILKLSDVGSLARALTVSVIQYYSILAKKHGVKVAISRLMGLILKIQTLCWWDGSPCSTCTHLLWARRCKSQTCCPRCWARLKLSVLWPVQQWERMGGLWCLNSISRHYPLMHLLLVFSVCHAGHVALEEAWSCLRDCLSWSKNRNTWFWGCTTFFRFNKLSDDCIFQLAKSKTQNGSNCFK